MQKRAGNRIILWLLSLSAVLILLGAAGCQPPDFEVHYMASGGFGGWTHTLHIEPLTGEATYESDLYSSFTFTLTPQEFWVLSTVVYRKGLYDLPGHIMAQCPGWDTYHYVLTGIDGDRGLGNEVRWEDDFCGSNPPELLEIQAFMDQLIFDHMPK